MSVPTEVRVELGERSYDVVIASSYERLSRFVAGRRRAAIVTQRGIPCAQIVADAVAAAGVEHATFLMGDGEDHKTPATVEQLCREFTQWGLLRGDVVLACGGGVVGDTAGFAAAVYYRGLDLIQVPTTLLAMVDSAIGGKTGVNLPEGKNLVGAFHQPRAVFANPHVLTTLPDRQYRCGLGEIAKYALIDDLDIDASALVAREASALTDVVVASARIKARYVEADEFERTGRRAVLNYGHTLGHALEIATGHSLLHGEAVAIGLVFAGHLASALERIDQRAVTRHEDLVTSLDLPTQAPAGLRADDLLSIMARDKKSGGGLTFVLAGPSGIETVEDPDLGAVRKAFAAVGVQS
jgi:5-deoxy-5-amino-3-dehydroquinate synthase